jgi:hypothetical protein
MKLIINLNKIRVLKVLSHVTIYTWLIIKWNNLLSKRRGPMGIGLLLVLTLQTGDSIKYTVNLLKFSKVFRTYSYLLLNNNGNNKTIF